MHTFVESGDICMHIYRRYLFGTLLACAVGALGVAVSAIQNPQPRASAQAAPQATTLTGCVEYGPRDSYVLATMTVPARPDLSNESALEREELAAAEHSYQLTPEKGEELSRLIGTKVRVAGTLSHVSGAAPAATGRAAGGRGQASAPPAIDQLSATDVRKLADHCDTHLTMFAM
jgi:hypothetical protein